MAIDFPPDIPQTCEYRADPIGGVLPWNITVRIDEVGRKCYTLIAWLDQRLGELRDSLRSRLADLSLSELTRIEGLLIGMLWASSEVGGDIRARLDLIRSDIHTYREWLMSVIENRGRALLENIVMRLDQEGSRLINEWGERISRAPIRLWDSDIARLALSLSRMSESERESLIISILRERHGGTYDLWMSRYNDPRERRRLVQDGTDSIMWWLRRYGVDSTIISMGWSHRVTGWLLLSTPPIPARTYSISYPPYASYRYDFSGLGRQFIYLDQQWWYTVGKSPEQVLDTVSTSRRSLVAWHIAVDAYGDPIAYIQTAQTEWVRSILFPLKASLEKWDTYSLPKGISLSLDGSERGWRATITYRAPSGIFISRWTTRESRGSISAESNNTTLWYLHEGRSSSGYLAYSETKMKYSIWNKDENEETTIGRALMTDWRKSVYTRWSLDIGASLGGEALLQTSGTSLQWVQSAEVWVHIWADTKWRLAHGLTGHVSYQALWVWSPDLYPNLFYRTPLGERNLSNFDWWRWWEVWLSDRNTDIRYQEKVSWWKKETAYRVSYLLSGVRISGTHEKLISHNIFQSPGSKSAITIASDRQDGVGWYMSSGRKKWYGYDPESTYSAGLRITTK